MNAELMDRFADLATTWMWFVLLAAWRALPILVIVAIIGLALRRRLTPSLHSLLLTLVVLRLLIPISIGSPISLHKWIDQWVSNASGTPTDRNQLMIARDHRAAILPNVDRYVVRDAPERAEVHSSQSPKFEVEVALYLACLIIVIAVSIGLLFRGALSHLRFAMDLRRSRLLDEQSLIDLLLRECDALAVGRRPRLREVESLDAPAVFGLFRHTICLPPRFTESLSRQELRWVLRHELAHIRRRDILVVTMASIANALHWFNPVVWCIVNRLRTAIEAAADRVALQSLPQSEVAGYAKLLLRLAENSVAAKRSPTLGLISFASGKDLKRRVALLLREENPQGRWMKLLSVGFVGALGSVGLTDASQVTNNKMPELRLVASDSLELKVLPAWSDPLSNEPFLNGTFSNGPLWDGSVGDEPGAPTVLKTYDITSLLQSIDEMDWQTDKLQLERLTTWVFMPPSLKDKLTLDGNTLSAELTVRQHELLEQTLDLWKHGEPKQISIEARFIQTNTKTASSIDWAGRRIDGLTIRGLGPAIAARIAESELAQLVRRVSTESSGNILLAPRVTLYDGQTATISDLVQRPFVTGVDAKADGRLQPLVSIVNEGLSFVLRPKTSADNGITLAFQVCASSVGKVSYANLPIKSSRDAEPLTVQVPATEKYELSSSVKLAAGESVVVAIPRVFNNEPGADAETTMIVALTPRTIDLQEPSISTAPQ